MPQEEVGSSQYTYSHCQSNGYGECRLQSIAVARDRHDRRWPGTLSSPALQALDITGLRCRHFQHSDSHRRYSHIPGEAAFIPRLYSLVDYNYGNI